MANTTTNPGFIRTYKNQLINLSDVKGIFLSEEETRDGYDANGNPQNVKVWVIKANIGEGERYDRIWLAFFEEKELAERCMEMISYYICSPTLDLYVSK